MSFKTEEELEAWFAAEKERLSDEFTKQIDQDKTSIPKHRARFDAEMKKLLTKYNANYEIILAQENKKTLKKKS